MSCTLDYHSLDAPPGMGLCVTQCGYQQAGEGHSVGPLRSVFHSVTFVLDGCGTYTVGGVRYVIHAGQGFAILPGASISYRADDSSPWKYIYAIFRGYDAAALLRDAGLTASSPVFDFDPDAFRDDLQSMYQESQSPDPCGYDVTGCFLLLMSRLVRRHKTAQLIQSPGDYYITRAVSYFHDHYPYSVTLSDLAAFLGIDRTYLHRLFIRHFGISPMRWLTEYRLERSLVLMKQDGVPLSEIALSVGFYDSSHFTRSFIRRYGVTPKVWRERTLSENG